MWTAGWPTQKRFRTTTTPSIWWSVTPCSTTSRTSSSLFEKFCAFSSPVDASSSQARCLLSLRAQTQPLAAVVAALGAMSPISFLSGPEGGLSPAEEARALDSGYRPVRLGPRVLRAETAALAALALLGGA